MTPITAIIAIRNELPDNVKRTVASVKAAGGIPVLIEDNPPLGCGYRRHQGIVRCETEHCVLVDGHMTFSPDCFEAISAWLDKHPSDLTCTRMQSVGHDWADYPGKAYHGARLELCHEAAGEQFWPIASRWRKGDTGDGPIGAVMGACYGLTRTAYIERWGCPLSILQAWGCDEEALSVAAWMTGGRVALVPGMARHMYAAPKVGGGGPIGMRDAVRIWANRVALLSAIPMPDPERARLVEWLKRTDIVRVAAEAINHHADMRRQQVERMYEALAAGPLDWAGVMAQQEEGDMAQAKKKAGKGKAKAATKPKAEKRPYTVAPRVMDPGVKCVHCGHLYDHRITHTYPNGNRRRKCGGCGRNFVTMRCQEAIATP